MRPDTDLRTRRFQRLLRGRGEVAISARARRMRHVRVLTAIAGVMLVIGAFGVYRLLSPMVGAEPPGFASVTVRCMSCGVDQVVRRPASETDDAAVCPRCGQRALHKLWACRECGDRFVPGALADAVKCPRCGSMQVGSAPSPAP